MTIEIVRRGAVAVIVRQGRLLVIRRSEHVVAPLAYCFPGGGLEGDEDESTALVREIHEELSAIVRPVERLWQSVTPWGVALAWWLAELPAEAMIVPNPAEVACVHWLAVGEMAALDELLSSNRDFLAALARGEFIIPGLSAPDRKD